MNDKSTFDPEAFLTATVTDAMETRRTPIPEGEFQAVIDDFKIESGTSQKTGDPWVRLDVKWAIDDDKVRDTVGIPKPTTRQGILLDISDSGGLATGRGKNIGLGRLREAVGLNKPGEPFSFDMLKGKVATVKIGHRTYEGEIFDEVRGVAKF